MSWFTDFFGGDDEEDYVPSLAEQIEEHLRSLKLLTVDDIAESISKLHKEVRRIKASGVSVWNAKEVMPKIFDVVDGSFVTMEALVEKISELEQRLDAIAPKKDDVPPKV